jgi:large subunit ribosomal protein L25
MEEVVLKAEHRSVTGKQVKALRRAGLLPAVMYGSHIEPTPIQLKQHDTMLALRGISGSALLTIDLEGQPHKALIREKQYDFIRRTLKHLDFQIISMSEKLRLNVAVELVGTSEAVQLLNGVLVINLNSLDIECLPGDLPGAIQVDVSALKKIGDAITVGDLKLSDKIIIYNDPAEVVVVATGQAADEEVEAAGGIEPEVIEKGKKEEDF